jgi:large repetitive protein
MLLDYEQSSAHQVTIRSTDAGGLSTDAIFRISLVDVEPENAPVATIDSYSTNEDETLNIASAGVLLNDTDADTDPLTAILVSGVQHGTLALNADGSFSYTPDANYNGLDSFTYKPNDGQADSNIASVNLTVTPVNDVPAASNDSYAMTEHTVLTVNAAAGVLANDSDVDGDPLYAALVSGPAHGKLTFNSDGSFVYKPLGHYDGPDSFTYKAFDGTASSDVTTVSITVNPVNHTLAIRDFSGDTTSDIVRQDDRALPGIWAMDGTTHTDVAILPNPGSDWLLV